MSEEEEDAKILRSNDTLGHLLADSLKGGDKRAFSMQKGASE